MLVIELPGAPRSTLVAPWLEKLLREPFEVMLATAMTQSQPRAWPSACRVHW
ncbi:hypothetical protein BH23CHL8_BH23CHL8_31990 [soil metagenome]